MAWFRRGTAYASVALFVVLAGCLAYLISERESSLAETSRYNLQWSASQSVIELTRLHSALALVVSHNTESQRDEAILRYDILMNRMRLLQDGEFKEFARHSPDNQSIIDGAAAILARVDPLMRQLHDSASGEIAYRLLSPLVGHFVSLAATANRHGAEQVVQAQSELTRLHWLFTAMLLTLLGTGAVQFWLLSRNNRLLRSTNDQLERSTIELRGANELAQAGNKAKSDFLAKMSHEIRTPMNGLMGMTEILSQTPLNERQTRLLETIRTSSDTLLTIINDILDLSRVEAGKMELDRQAFCLRSCIEGAVELVSEQAFGKGVELTLLVDDAIPRFLHGDAGRLRQVCINLLGNAIKFTEQGEVAVHVSAAAPSAGSLAVRFEVRDTGIGIDAATQGRLFLPFSQGDNSIRRKFGGTGLGLAISRHLVELMGGEIRLDSSVGVGTTITFTLPLPAADAAGNVPAPPLLANTRILIVDDRATTRAMYIAYLSGQGAQVDWAPSSEQALVLLDTAQAAGRPFGAVIADRVSPRQSGFSLIDRMRLVPSHGAVPVILAMALTWRGHGNQAETAGASAVISKPVRRDDLVKAVAECLQRRVAATESPVGKLSPEAARSGRMGAHVLVAEDNPVNVEVACVYLEAMGCTFDVATTGKEAVAAWEHGKYAVVLMDCQMPELDGLSAARAIRAREALLGRRRVPIIAVTANAFAEDRTNCIAAGMDDYLSKPYTEEQLIARIGKWASGHVSAPVAARGPAKDAATAGHPFPAAPPRADFGATGSATTASKTVSAGTRRQVKSFTEHGRAAAERLPAAVQGNDVTTARLLAHTLKSASISVGAFRLAAQCARLEEMATHGTLPAARELVESLLGEMREISAGLTAEQSANARTDAA